MILAIDGVYDVMGNKIKGKGRITINDVGKATTELVWDCTVIPSGVYFIVIRWHGGSESIPAIIQ
ncbi:MAG: hypothetical protein WHV60_10120 [Bacteroidota bacterium]